MDSHINLVVGDYFKNNDDFLKYASKANDRGMASG